MKTILVLLFVCCAVLLDGSSGYSFTPLTPAAHKSGQERVLVIGLIPEQNLFKQMDRYSPLAAYLSSRLGMQVKLTVLSRYGTVIDAFTSTRLDGAFFGSFTYALAHAKLGVEVLARPENLDGSSTYRGMIFVRKDSGITGIGAMQGKRFAFVDRATTAGYLLPLKYFAKHGIKDYAAYLGETYFTGTHDDAVYDVVNRRADVGAAKSTVLERLALADRRVADGLVVLEKSPEFPENGLAVRKGLDAALKRRIKEVMLTMHYDPQGREVLTKFGARRFIETTDSDYRAVYSYASSLGLTPAAFDPLSR